MNPIEFVASCEARLIDIKKILSTEKVDLPYLYALIECFSRDMQELEIAPEIKGALVRDIISTLGNNYREEIVLSRLKGDEVNGITHTIN